MAVAKTLVAKGGGMLVAAVLAVGLSAPAPAEVTSAIGEAPTEQPWGAAPADIASYDNGELLNSRPVQANVLGEPLLATAWQVRYKSIDNHGDPNVYISTVLIPKTEWTGTGTRPLLSYQFAEDGVAYKCAPSWQLSSGTPGESGVVLLALKRGWAVTVPDYEGPASEFLGAEGSARGVLDGIRATRNFTPAGVGDDAPVGAWGYSGGALATLRSFNAIPGVSSAINVGLAGLDRSYPERNVMHTSTTPASPTTRSARCSWASTRFSSRPPRRHRALIYHAIFDELAPIGPARQLAKRYCAAGTRLKKVEGLLGEHTGYAVTAAPVAVGYLADRFAGKAAPTTC